MNVSVIPIFPIRDRNPNEKALPTRRSIDSKVLGFVLERICQAKGALLSSAAAPQIVLDLLPAREAERGAYASREKKKIKLRKTPLLRKTPIGLRPVDAEGWLNALMQFILFAPGLAELFFFAPRSLDPFQEFIEQYEQDQQEHRPSSSANGTVLFRCLASKVSRFSLHESFQFLLQALHSNWELHKNVEIALGKGVSTDLFVIESSLKKQFFTASDSVCYDLDAFIELRPDGTKGNYIAYVKVEGMWYQCDNERITQLRSTSLGIPLHRAVLLHYKRIDFGKRGWAREERGTLIADLRKSSDA